MTPFYDNRSSVIAFWIVIALTVITALVLLVNTATFWLGDDDTSGSEGSSHSISTEGLIDDAEFDLSDPAVNGLIDQIVTERAARLMAKERARDLREENDRLRRER